MFSFSVVVESSNLENDEELFEEQMETNEEMLSKNQLETNDKDQNLDSTESQVAATFEETSARNCVVPQIANLPSSSETTQNRESAEEKSFKRTEPETDVLQLTGSTSGDAEDNVETETAGNNLSELSTSKETGSSLEIYTRTKSFEDPRKNFSAKKTEIEPSQQQPEVESIPEVLPIQRLLQNDGQIEMSSFENDPSDESCDNQNVAQLTSDVEVQNEEKSEPVLEVESATLSPDLNELVTREDLAPIRSDSSKISLTNLELVNGEIAVNSNIEIDVSPDFQNDVVNKSAIEKFSDDLSKEDRTDNGKDLPTKTSQQTFCQNQVI